MNKLSEESPTMSSAASTALPALLVVHSGDRSHAIEPGRGVVTIGREPQAGVQIDDPQISQEHLRAEATNGEWRIVDSSPSGMFVDGLRKTSVTVTDKTTVRFGDPTAGKVLTFEVVRPPKSVDLQEVDDSDEQGDNIASIDLDPGVVRAGAAAAARRRELDISQRSLAADGIINAGALIAFEKGRSWPRERTRAKLEEVLQWPAGTIDRMRHGEPIADDPAAPAAPVDGPAAPDHPPADGAASLIAQAVVAAVDGCSLAISALPPADDPEFTERSAPILADLRQLETIAVRATRISQITPELIKALSAVRRHRDELMTLGANAPDAPLAQRLYAARRRANLSTLEIAQAAGVDEEMVVRAEDEEPLPAHVTAAIETLIGHIN
ncbi:FHA domain-containing protein [Mycobacterium sp. Aquia_213]|uniref:ESX-1 type VII secretion system transcriptional regulator EspM n=1 Tax=Mycobacterium sp. Aquia_213 TaxID=2991728 RepID=UPI00226EF5F9|nr:FHA domain-containing protein [Mycobacterium sp. Aquia_213]WAC91714.1 FHA domain-containing protein [Mycobacterium sp. Aquia_213]